MREERGASVVMVAAAFMLLLGMAAIAIDVGAGFNERRASQTAADVGALAGAVEFLHFGKCDSTDDAVDKVLDDACTRVLEVVRENLGEIYVDDADYAAIWRECEDLDRPAVFAPLPTSGVYPWDGFSGGAIDCISASHSEIRVRLPDQFIEASFGRALGVEELSTFATAHSGIIIGEGPSPIVPFGALSGAAGHDCLLEPPNGFADPPCVGGETGSYGALLTQLWGSDGSIADCGNSSWPPGANQLMFSIAYGMDHPLAALNETELLGLSEDANAFDQAVNNNDPDVDEITILDRCTYVDGEAYPWDRLNGSAADVGPIDTVRVDSGSSMSDATLKGFITGRELDFTGLAVEPDELLPRIVGSLDCNVPPGAHPDDPAPGLTSYLCLTVGADTQLVDSTPLWSHLDGGFSIPEACDEQTEGEGYQVVNTSTEMDCVLKSPDVTGPIFGDSIKYNRRFVWVPEFHYTDWGTGIGWQPIARFKSAYIHAFWFNTPGSDVRWAPDEDDESKTLAIPITNPNALITVTAFLIPDHVLPVDIAEECPTCANADFDVELRR